MVKEKVHVNDYYVLSVTVEMSAPKKTHPPLRPLVGEEVARRGSSTDGSCDRSHDA